MNRLRRAPLKRLVAACAAVVLLGGAVAVAASAIGGPTPPPAQLADAIHDALTATPVQGISAHITFTDNLVTGAALQSQSPLITGASGRVWIGSDGDARLELQSGNGDTEIVWDGTTLYYLDAASSTLYEWTPPRHDDGGAPSGTTGPDGDSAPTHAVPSVADIQKAIMRLAQHANVSGAVPDDVAGQPAYSVRISPSDGHGGLFGGIALWWDATHGVPLRFAVYAAGNTDPVLELTADDVSYGPIDPAVFATPTAAKVVVLGGNAKDSGATQPTPSVPEVTFGFTPSAPPSALAGMNLDQMRQIHLRNRTATLLTYGQGLGGLLVFESQALQQSSSTADSLPTVDINGTTGHELATALGTIITFQRDGVQYVVAGSVPAATELDAADGL